MALGSDEYPGEVNIRSYKPNTNVHVGQLKKAIEVLKHAKKPVFLAGGGVNISRANKLMCEVAEITNVPVVTTIMGKGAIPTDHSLYLGNIGIHGSYAANTAISECDVLFSIGTRFNDRITGKIDEFAKNATIVHIDIDPASISKNVAVDIPIVADAKKALTKMKSLVSPVDTEEWLVRLMKWKEEYPIHMKSESGRMTPENILNVINDMFDRSVIVTDVGQNQLWTTQYIELKKHRQLLTSGGLGTMGYGFPAALGAKLGNPDKDVICISGDGGMQMNIQELATAVVLELPLILCVFNNTYLGNVRQWQELFYGRRYSSTCLKARRSCGKNCFDKNKECPKYTPDFVKLAESYEAQGIRVFSKEEIIPAFEKARMKKDRPTIIEFIIEEEANVFPMVPVGKPLSEMMF